MVEMTQMASNKFRNMSVLCALFVVIIHCRPEFEHGCLAWYVKEVLENGICEMAVPFFFLASGFFIAPKIAAGLYKAEVAKRIRTLLVPYVFWLLMYLMLAMALSRHLSLPTPGQLGFDPFDCPALSPLWYVRSLFCLVLLSPIVVFCLKNLLGRHCLCFAAFT